MIKAIVSDLSRVILNAKDLAYTGSLNALHRELLNKFGEYDAFEYFTLNEELLGFYSSLKNRYSLNIFTSGVVQYHPQLKAQIEVVFENVFSAEGLGLSKSDPHSYKVIAEKLELDPTDILYIDDQEENVLAAKSVGMVTCHFETNSSDFDFFEKNI